MILLDTPTTARLVNYAPSRPVLEKALAYVDKSVDFELRKTRDSIRRWETPNVRGGLVNSMGLELYEERLEQLKEKAKQLKIERDKTILFEDDAGLWTYSGVAHRIALSSKDTVTRNYTLPDARQLPWANLPRYEDRPYQKEALEKLLLRSSDGPCGVELATGSGKSTIIRNIVKHFGLGTLIMAPSISIAEQLYDDLVYHLGSRYVGMYGNGKKQFDKQVVVGIDDSLRLVEPGSAAWKAFKEKPVFCVDESHLTPAASLQAICFGLMANAPYRFFFSATQIRNDGLDIVLDGITGPIVLRKDVKELVDEGWLAKPTFKQILVSSYKSYKSPDAVRMTRQHLYYNRVVNEQAAGLANNFVSVMKRPTLILVKEVEQFSKMLPHFKHKAKFAHGPLTKANKELVPEEYRKDKPKELVAAFNRGEIPILVGTSCISTGTDIQVAEAGIYLMGGSSEIEVRQGIGRFTRGGFNGTVVNPWTGQKKLNAVVVDFDVVIPNPLNPKDRGVLHRHAMERYGIFLDTYGPVDTIDWTQRL